MCLCPIPKRKKNKHLLFVGKYQKFERLYSAERIISLETTLCGAKARNVIQVTFIDDTSPAGRDFRLSLHGHLKKNGDNVIKQKQSRNWLRNHMRRSMKLVKKCARERERERAVMGGWVTR